MSEDPDADERESAEEIQSEESIPEEVQPEEAQPEEAIPEEERVPLSSLRERVDAQGAQADADVDDDAPLSELAREAQGSSEAERSELFEEVDVADMDSEAVWEAVVEEGQPPEELLEDATEPSSAEPTDQPDEHVVDKREFCQRCEFFTEPPTVACTNEGTEIVELVDKDSFCVRNCPKVGEDDEALRSMISDEQS